MTSITPKELYEWCKIPYQELENHAGLKARFRLCKDSDEMGRIMARGYFDEMQKISAEANKEEETEEETDKVASENLSEEEKAILKSILG